MKNLRPVLGLLAVVAAGACSSKEAAPVTSGGVDLSPPPAGQGVQFQMVSALDPGVETERCRFFVAPAEGYYVNRQQVKFTPGSHHVLLYTTPYEKVPTKDEKGNDVDTSGIFECGKSGPTAHWKV